MPRRVPLASPILLIVPDPVILSITSNQIRGRCLEISWELSLGDRPTTHYVVHVIRSAEQFEWVQEPHR